jgi:hypothetical protein
LAAGKKRGFCPRASAKAALSAELAAVASIGGGQKAWFLPAR